VDKRYTVFLSSTFIDLADERRAVTRAFLDLDYIPVAMEGFPASSDPPLDLIESILRDCDYYVLVIGNRYGSLDENLVSYTEREYDLARSLDIPTLAFLHEHPGELPAKWLDTDPKAQENLERFRKKVQSHTVKNWTTAENLASAVGFSLTKETKSHQAEGWVRGRFAAAPTADVDSARLKQRIAELESELGRNSRGSAENVASGADTFAVRHTVSGVDYEEGGNFSAVRTTEWTWSQLFASLGPLMHDQASAKTLAHALNGRLSKEVDSENAELEQEGRDIRIERASIDSEDVDTIIYTFAAQGLIERATAAFSLDETETFWCLTTVGEESLIALRAQRSTAESVSTIRQDD